MRSLTRNATRRAGRARRSPRAVPARDGVQGGRARRGHGRQRLRVPSDRGLQVPARGGRARGMQAPPVAPARLLPGAADVLRRSDRDEQGGRGERARDAVRGVRVRGVRADVRRARARAREQAERAMAGRDHQGERALDYIRCDAILFSVRSIRSAVSARPPRGGRVSRSNPNPTPTPNPEQRRPRR